MFRVPVDSRSTPWVHNCTIIVGALSGVLRCNRKSPKRRRASASTFEPIGGTFEPASTSGETSGVSSSWSSVDLKRFAQENAKLLAKLRDGTITNEDKRRLATLNKELGALAGAKKKAGTAVKAVLAKKGEALARMKTRKVEIGKVLEDLASSEQVDVLFMVDCTGSMSPYIQAVKDKINEIVNHVMARSSYVNMRFGFLGYRDFCDGPKRFERLDFTSDDRRFHRFVNSLQATGGGDGCEDVVGAINLAGAFAWTNPTRLLVHIADCPCHGRAYQNGAMGDDFPDGDPYGLEPGTVLRVLQDAGVDYYFGRVTGMTDIMINVFNSQVPSTSRTSGNYIKTVALDDIGTFVESISEAVTTSIAATFMVETGHKPSGGAITVEVASGAPMSTRHVKFDTEKPTWDSIRPQEAKVFSTRKFKTISDLRTGEVGLLAARPTDAPAGTGVWIKIAPSPFAAGANRYAHWAKLGMLSGGGSIHARSTAVEWETHVAKQLKTSFGKKEDAARYMAQMENSMVASFLAKQYNEVKEPDAKAIDFVRSYVLEVDGEFYTIEKPLPDDREFIRFSANSGAWIPKRYNPTLGAFTRWTLQVTDGHLLVSDLQGVELADRFVLTDPAIHCEDLTRFGGTNLGPDFMERVLKGLKAVEKCGGSFGA